MTLSDYPLGKWDLFCAFLKTLWSLSWLCAEISTNGRQTNERFDKCGRIVLSHTLILNRTTEDVLVSTVTKQIILSPTSSINPEKD